MGRSAQVRLHSLLDVGSEALVSDDYPIRLRCANSKWYVSMSYS